MALDQKRRQKKLAKKAAKRKMVVTAKKSALKAGWLVGNQMALAVSGPIQECLMPKGLFDLGIGNIVISRKMPTGNMGVSFFLVDVFCLGVKNCFFTVLSPSEYASRIRSLFLDQNLEAIEPACAVKLIENAVSYARDLGFSPHREYAIAKRIFEDIDPASCPPRI